MQGLARRRRILLGALGAASLAAGLVVPLVASATTPSAPTRVVPCVGAPQYRPGKLVVACGDGNWYLTGLHWVRWSSSVAIARGTVHLNDCQPDCAQGTFHTTGAVVVLSDPGGTAHAGTVFTALTELDATRLPGSSGTVSVQPLPRRPSSP